ncbi:MAG: hypothetical protein H7301_11345 [Cryobacterium sp.]|nr:hypothetical protein [Oligoflexia bacterium]
MMQTLLLAVKFLPYWTLPLFLIFGEMAFIFRRRGNRGRMKKMLVVSIFFFALTAAFFVFRWDMVAIPWIERHI